MDPNYLNSLVTFIVGGFALAVYWLGKKHEKKNAATVLIMDIRHAEQVVMSILEKNAVDTFVKKIISENNWGKYKHLFASDFSHDDFSVFNRFFEACIDISEARERMLEIFNAGLRAKAETVQQLLLSIENPNSQEGQARRQEIISYSCSEPYTFDPDDPKARIYRSLQMIGRLTNTVAFEKLKKIAKLTD